MSQTQRPRIVVVGSINFDVVVKAERLPKAGENLLASNLKFFPGGKGANQAVAASRLGADAVFIGAVGEDIVGGFLARELEQNGIDTTWVKRDPARTTGCAFIMIFPDGDHSMVVDPAANHSLKPADVERARDVIAQADVLCTVLEIPIDVVETSLWLARQAGKLSILDAGPTRHCPPEILKLANVVSPNEKELAYITGEEVSGRVSAREAAMKLFDLGVKTAVLKLGSDGSMLVTAKSWKHFPAYQVRVVDPTAAGDAFTAALAVEMAAGRSIEEAIRFANTAGALAVSKLGAQPSLPTRQEVEEFAARTVRIV